MLFGDLVPFGCNKDLERNLIKEKAVKSYGFIISYQLCKQHSDELYEASDNAATKSESARTYGQ
jgi:hypothetical protein